MSDPEYKLAHAKARGFLDHVIYNRMPGLYDAMDWLTLGVWWRLLSRMLDYIPPGGRVLIGDFSLRPAHADAARRADRHRVRRVWPR